MKIDIVSIDTLIEPSWHATYILRPDMVSLATSIGEQGLINPLIVQSGKNQVIDGTQRLRIIKGNKFLTNSFDDGVPVRFIDCNDLDAMILHVQLNRARGTLFVKHLSTIVKKLHRSGRVTEEEFMRLFSMHPDELEIMLDGSLIKHRDIPNYNYSRAWVPVEAPANTVEVGTINIERPPNADR